MTVLAAPLTNPTLWRKIAIEVGGAASSFFLNQLLEHGQVSGAADSMTWRRVQVQFARTAPSGLIEDRAIMSFDLLNMTSGDVDNTWITGDFTAFESAFATFWTSVKPYVHSSHALVEYRWYSMAFTDVNAVKPFVPSGTPVRSQTTNVPGTYTTTGVPYQVAMSVTEKTAWARHWGRFYLPGVGGGNFDGAGRFTSAICTSVANATQTLYNACATAGLYPVVPVTQIDKAPARVLLTVDAVQVDDTPDVIRRRRPKQTMTRTIRNT